MTNTEKIKYITDFIYFLVDNDLGNWTLIAALDESRRELGYKHQNQITK